MILIIGVAGSGKSTQSRMLASKKGWVWLSMGDLLRRSLEGVVEKQMLKGKLVDDAVVIEILEKEIKGLDTNKEILLDGFPRSFSQMPWLLESSNNLGTPVRAVVHLSAHKDVVMERLLNRGRVDDSPEAISKRFAEYERDILPILDMLREKAIPIVEVNAEQSEEKVHQDIVNGLGEAGISV